MSDVTPHNPAGMKPQRLLLVGGCGGIGRAVAQAAVHAGAQVAVRDESGWLPATVLAERRGIHLVRIDGRRCRCGSYSF